MSTWHQAQNIAALHALWQPHPTKWKCVCDKPDQPASCMTFDDMQSAQEHALATGAIVVAPRNRQ